jgi:DNA-binding HxlR family transcriptional regulator
MIRNALADEQPNSQRKHDALMTLNMFQPIPVRSGYSGRQEREENVYGQSSGEEQTVQFAITLIQGKWKIRILSSLQKGPARLSQLRRMFPEASKKMLTQHLREMERDGLIVRKDLSGKLRHVEYSLSCARGFAALQLISTLTKWSSQFTSPQLEAETPQYVSGK